MLIDEFEEWRLNPSNACYVDENSCEDNFSIFYQEYSAGQTFMSMLCVLASQIHALQVCVEGLIEDMEEDVECE